MKQEDLMNIAKNISKNAYTPSTDYTVGAALLAKSGTVYVGVNVEDSKILYVYNTDKTWSQVAAADDPSIGTISDEDINATCV